MSTPSFGSVVPPDDSSAPSLGSGAGSDREADERHDEDRQAGMGGLADDAQDRAQAWGGQARARARQEVERRSADLAERAAGTAEDLREVAEHLRSQGKHAPASVA